MARVGQIIAGVAVAAAVLFVTTSFARVGTLEFGLDWDHLTQTVAPGPLANGLHFLGGPWHSVVIYPGTLQNMVFSSEDSPSDELHTRTSDGLPVVLEVTYQYQLLVHELKDLFDAFGPGGYEAVYFDVAQHLLSEASTAYSAYQFFNSKETIAAFMQQSLNTYFTDHLHASVVSLQIQSCRLPLEFNDAITDTVTQRQNITSAAKYLDQQTVTLQTNLLVAGKQANATVATAMGAAQQLLLVAQANAAMALQNGHAEAAAFAGVKARLGFTNDEILRYVWWDAVGSSGAAGGGDASVLVGVNPAALIQQRSPT